MRTVTRRHDATITCNLDGLHGDLLTTVKGTLAAFSHLIKVGETSFTDLADTIEATYDMRNPNNRAAMLALREAGDE